MNKIILVGTSHIAKQSIRRVKKAIEENKPDIVAVELDSKRFYSIIAKKTKQKFSF